MWPSTNKWGTLRGVSCNLLQDFLHILIQNGYSTIVLSKGTACWISLQMTTCKTTLQRFEFSKSYSLCAKPMDQSRSNWSTTHTALWQLGLDQDFLLSCPLKTDSKLFTWFVGSGFFQLVLFFNLFLSVLIS